jgi:hypothetical protein
MLPTRGGWLGLLLLSPLRSRGKTKTRGYSVEFTIYERANSLDLRNGLLQPPISTAPETALSCTPGCLVCLVPLYQVGFVPCSETSKMPPDIKTGQIVEAWVVWIVGGLVFPTLYSAWRLKRGKPLKFLRLAPPVSAVVLILAIFFFLGGLVSLLLCGVAEHTSKFEGGADRLLAASQGASAMLWILFQVFPDSSHAIETELMYEKLVP